MNPRDGTETSARLAARIQQNITAADIDQLLARREQIDRLQAEVQERWTEELGLHPAEPWEAYHALRLVYACNWIARAYSIIGGTLAAYPDAPSVTSVQGVLLLVQLEDCIVLLRRSLTIRPGSSSPIPPMTLGPRVQKEGGPVPPSHLQALLAALGALRDEVRSELDRYSAHVAIAGAPVWVKIIDRRLRSELADTDDAVARAQAAVGATAPDRSAEAEDLLWSSLETHLWLGQVIFVPSLMNEAQTGRNPSPLVSGPWTVDQGDLRCLTPPEVQRRLEEHGMSAQLDDELGAFWTAKDWRLSADEQRFLMDVAELKRDAAIRVASYLDEAPYNEVWVAERSITAGNRYLLPGSEFAYDHRSGHDRIITDLQSPAP